jgi:hypothetical protein
VDFGWLGAVVMRLCLCLRGLRGYFLVGGGVDGWALGVMLDSPPGRDGSEIHGRTSHRIYICFHRKKIKGHHP